MNNAVSNFCEFYDKLTVDKLTSLNAVYDKCAVFEDPAHTINGLDDIARYFHNMLANISYCHFEIDDVIERDRQAFVKWVMRFSHPRLGKGKEIKVPGVSYIKFDARILYHRDYMDMGSMIYEHVPLLGSVIRKVKSEMVK
ncbi:nuclear transport factor 2 family protein [Dasania marina]|uniref:nuclear transport factor 2 family protein n=1 Tax=Dasania marina TaxID=471499 RepID=UPI000381555C|nr:nuclear transport factor 2 family protein [Dasania marina]